MAESDVASRQLAQFLLEKPHQLPLLALHAIGMVGVARQHGQIERRHRPGLPVAKLPGRRLQSHVDHAGHDAELVEQVEGRGMEGRPAQLHHQPGFGGKQHGGNAAASQGQGGCQPHRAGTDDNHAIVRHAKKRSPHAPSAFRRETPPARRFNITARCQAQKISGLSASTIGRRLHAERPTTTQGKTDAET